MFISANKAASGALSEMFQTEYIAESRGKQMHLLDVSIYVNGEVNTLPLPLPCILWPQPHGRPLLLSSLRAA
jgi:hypothetical protein